MYTYRPIYFLQSASDSHPSKHALPKKFFEAKSTVPVAKPLKKPRKLTANY
jgi:hypothetical protein